MQRILSALLGIALISCVQAEAATSQTLSGAVHNIANEVRKTLKDNAILKGRKVAIGFFDPKDKITKKGNVGVGIRQKMIELLQDLRDEDSDFTLSGSYTYTDGTGDNSNLEIVRFSVKINDKNNKVIHTFPEIEINDSVSIAFIGGAFITLPEDQDLTTRNRIVKNALANPTAEKPGFDIVGGYRVAERGNPALSVGVLKKKTFDGTAIPVIPENVKGLAFATIDVGEFYEIEIANNDTIDVLAKISIDGLDVANTFSSDKDDKGNKVNYPGFVVIKGSRGIIKGWLNTVDPSRNDNVLTFAINELGKGAASKLGTRGDVGVITVQFREATPPGQKPTGRGGRGGESDGGPPLSQNFELQHFEICDVFSTISIRYNRPK